MFSFFYLYHSATSDSNQAASDESSAERRRRLLLKTLMGAFLALVLGRICQMALPFRPRPMNATDFVFLMPPGTEKKMGDWSSFPSDHLALFASLATGYVLANRRFGLIYSLYVAVFIACPRIFLGLHYLTDVLVGSLMGCLCTFATQKLPVCESLAVKLDDFGTKYPGVFQAMMFFVCFEVATLFDSIRELGSFLHKGHL